MTYAEPDYTVERDEESGETVYVCRQEHEHATATEAVLCNLEAER